MGSIPDNHKLIFAAEGIRDRTIKYSIKPDPIQAIESIAAEKNDENDEREPFYVLNLDDVVASYEKWTECLPRVQPFYAVKCNPDVALLGALAALGSGFDCASKGEIQTVLALGVSPSRIVYANPCKAESHIRYAKTVGVNLTTFDSLHELDKIKKWHPKCELLLRIKPPVDGGARCELGSKYGALEDEFEPLLKAALSAELNIVGVSFHIGSGDADSAAYDGAIRLARTVFDLADNLGFTELKILNIGGGFTSDLHFDKAALAVNSAVETYFKNHSGLTVISEPGRFFAEPAFTLAANVIGKRVRGEIREYWINDGIYGSMNCILYDHARVTCMPLTKFHGLLMYSSTVFGPTCDGLDTILTGHQLPELEVGDWLVFPNMGAYTCAAGSAFNGFDTGRILTYLVSSNRF